MRIERWCLVCLLLLTGPALQADPAGTAASASATEICEGLLSRDPASYDRAVSELGLADHDVCEALGRKLLDAAVRDAETILTAASACANPKALVVAFVALESPLEDVRRASLDALLASPHESVLGCGDACLSGVRRQRLQEMLSSATELGLVCEALPRERNGNVRGDPRVALSLVLLADRYFGSRGFLGLLRGLSEVMRGLGEEDDGDTDAAALARKAQDSIRRKGAESLFRDIWIGDLVEFHYVADAPAKERRSAVEKIHRKLDDLAQQEVELGDRTFRGCRYGDHLIGLFGSDIVDARAAAYLRMQAFSGEEIPLFGETYATAVEEFNALSRRDLAKLRKSLRSWWALYRAETEPG